ncbi:heme ABC transporter permease [Erythrobacter arachoides]|uniref:Heme exporter protein C n=1 Tax=Aurantiacibacter arachoides TaxID=1850444 RepID=A0A845A5T6_9SPHN|nr:heme ABC transporter permease CcmC [Aurantiacibacter arachoides]MXO92919.1 heme ABC transporter permease [Aurantiacibacter arachoides]GGD53421.1 cytochrome C biogenesis protein CcmC [Aurantiacibacter arachoides]
MHAYANPARFLKLARWLTPLLLGAGLLLTAGSMIYGLAFAPAERLQGETVRILFIHVPAVWLGMAGWATIAIASFAELVWRHPLAALAARGAAVPGAVFTFLGLATGSIWGRPAWGTWWVWDGRLTSFLVLFFLFLGYIALAQAVAREGGSSRVPAIFGLVGAVNIPIIHFSVLWWNSLHQPPSITTGGSAMSGEFLSGLLVAVLGFSLLFGAVVLMRMRALLAETQAEARLRRRALQGDMLIDGPGEPADA